MATWALLAIVSTGLALILALALGWNDPRPHRPPDWQASGLPLDLTAPPGLDTYAWVDQTADDIAFEVLAMPVSGPEFNGYGVLVRAQDQENGYVFAVGSDGYYAVLRLDDGQETSLVDWEQFPHVRRGQTANLLRVTCSGTTCYFTINDEYATEVTASPVPAGRLGLWARSFEQEEVVVRFLEAHAWAPP
jgi:hypothetical protein